MPFTAVPVCSFNHFATNLFGFCFFTTDANHLGEKRGKTTPSHPHTHEPCFCLTGNPRISDNRLQLTVNYYSNYIIFAKEKNIQIIKLFAFFYEFLSHTMKSNRENKQELNFWVKTTHHHSSLCTQFLLCSVFVDKASSLQENASLQETCQL